ncbi:MAG: FecR domain-containing protein [Deltaproteobacteria bacterium]|nr:FecR domain-containing protein [Deltaproteobacteria bacterium]
MSERCPRIWEVEAIRDGRLRGESRLAHERHRESCEDCRQEAQALAALAERVGRMPTGATDDLGLRRLRQCVLERADAEASGRKRHTRRRIALLGIAAALFAALLIVTTAWIRNAREAPIARVDLVVVATGEPGTRWTRTTESSVERFRLNDGVLSLRVERPAGARRVLVEVPDGEIEDLGTTFRVEVRGGKTARVGVQQGIVRVRLRDGVAIDLKEGESWTREPAQPVLSVEHNAVSTPVEVASAAPSVSQIHSGTGVSRVDAGTAAPAASGPAVGSPEEDAAYLRILELLRAGRRDAAREAARVYLAAYPAGFRRAEVQRVAEDTPR